MLRLLALGVAAALAFLGVACSTGGDGGAATDQGLTRVAEADGITVEATWLTEGSLRDEDADLGRYSLEEFVLLEVKMDTHSGDLGAIDMEGEASLSQGGAEQRPEAWVSTSDDAHHRAGFLVFARVQDPGAAELILRIGDAELAFLWEAVPAT